MENLKLVTNNSEIYTQVCIWRNTIVGEGREKEFEDFFLAEYGFRIKYIKEVKMESGNHVLFYINSDDVPKFAIARLFRFNGEISWIEDFIDNYSDDEELNLDEFRTW